MTVTVQVPATTANLGSGFDAIGAALSWHSFVTLEPCEGLVVEVVGEGESEIARDESNIAVKAIQTLLRQLPNDVAKPLSKGFRLKLDNRFPLTRGLGSSAAARVGALVAANSLLGEPFSAEQLLKIATELEGHADNVAAALLGGIVVAVPTDEGITWAKFSPPVELHIVLLVPDFTVETEKARAVLPFSVTREDAVFNLGRAALLVAALSTGQIELLKVAMQDRLHQPYRQMLMPWMPQVFEAALSAGALGVHLSGAGPTVAAWCEDMGKAETVAEAMWQSLNAMGVSCSWKIVGLDSRGAKVVQG
ncbi:MAG: homoserine kinase [Armatimonadetes bacterium]|nr:homoserine kinase [Armatimonadota bacterium]MCX7969155.1 homoserine kinase [Armatimonadota bacterium]MDW8143898.1 homoserine kinase [Armatimonadota bacterium]